MIKGLILGIVFGLLLAVGGIVYYFHSGRAPVAVADPPMPYETKLANTSVDEHIKRQNPGHSPVPADEANLLAGAAVFKENCAVCHGLPDPPRPYIATAMWPEPGEFFARKTPPRIPEVERFIYWIAANGIRLSGMPAFRNKLTETQLWQVAQLVANAYHLSDTVKAALAPDAPLAAPVAIPANVPPMHGHDAGVE